MQSKQNTKDNNQQPLTREMLMELISKNGNTAEGLNLRGRDLRGIDISNLNLNGIILSESTLARSNLMGTNLDRALLLDTDFMASTLDGAKIRGADLRGASFLTASLKGTDLSWSNLDGTDFSLAKMEKIYLTNSIITNRTQLQRSIWGKKYQVGEELCEPHRYKNAEEVYRNLKIWHQQAGIYDLMGEFHYREWVSRKKRRGEIVRIELKNRRVKKSLAAFITFIPYWLGDVLFGYGERWAHILYWALLLIIGPAILYFIWGSMNFIEALYFSAASFTALGYGTWAYAPENWVKYVGVTQPFFGVTLMALFLVTFTRKWIR